MSTSSDQAPPNPPKNQDQPQLRDRGDSGHDDSANTGVSPGANPAADMGENHQAGSMRPATSGDSGKGSGGAEE